MILFILIAFSILLFVIPKRLQALYSLALSAVQASVTSIWAVKALMYNTPVILSLPFSFWHQPISLVIDPLSAIFILIVNFTVITGSIYAMQYLKAYKAKRKPEFSLHFFSFYILHLSMLLVCMLKQSIGFLVAWELMSVSSFLLVIFESEKPNTLSAGIKYLIQMHIGALFLTIAFILLYNKTGSWSFDGLKTYFAANPNLPLLVLFFVGFGIKAGFIPLHTWLPHAHPAAPSHVSAIMSGVMIKMGIYGIFRVLLYVQHDYMAIGIGILAISLISGVGGVAMAIIQHDLKKLLAYHSIENIGIIGIGMGIGMIGIGTHNNALALLGFIGSLLHVLNHSLFKSLLFYSAGSVYIRTHTKNIEHLGGLIKKMPQTALLFLVASLAICGLPPFNGFVSEFFIYNGFINGIISGTLMTRLIIMAAIIGLVVIGGLAVFCFTKAFGVVFLGTSRHADISEVKEMSWGALIPQYIILCAILFIGIFPGMIIGPFYKVAVCYLPEMQPVPVNTIITIENVGRFSLLFIGAVVVLYIVRSVVTRKRALEYKPTWGCGYTGPVDKMQYTATSYAENYVQVAGSVVNQKAEYRKIEPADIFPLKREFATHSEDATEVKVYNRIVRFLLKLLDRMAFVQTGYLQHYILYAFVLLIVMIILTVLNVI